METIITYTESLWIEGSGFSYNESYFGIDDEEVNFESMPTADDIDFEFAFEYFSKENQDTLFTVKVFDKKEYEEYAGEAQPILVVKKMVERNKERNKNQ